MEKKERKSMVLFVVLLAGLAVIFSGCPADAADRPGKEDNLPKSETGISENDNTDEWVCEDEWVYEGEWVCEAENPWECERDGVGNFYSGNCQQHYQWWSTTWYRKDDWRWWTRVDRFGKDRVIDPDTGRPREGWTEVWTQVEPLRCSGCVGRGNEIKNQRFDDELGRWVLTGDVTHRDFSIFDPYQHLDVQVACW